MAGDETGGDRQPNSDKSRSLLPEGGHLNRLSSLPHHTQIVYKGMGTYFNTRHITAAQESSLERKGYFRIDQKVLHV
jgi:hypothetical protein